MDDFLALERAARESAFSLDNQMLPTQAQCEADSYRKGIVQLHGLNIPIENPRGSVRSGKTSDGREWSNVMAAHYGYICDTLGADGDEVDVFVGTYPESRRVWIINQVFGGKFDEMKCMLGFIDADGAKAAYTNSYTRDWTGFGSMVGMSMDQFKKWLRVSSTKPAAEKPVEKILWSGDAPRALTFDAVLYQIRRRDSDGLIFDSVTEGEVLQDAEEVLTLDAMTSPYQQLPKRAQLLMNMLNRVGDLQVNGFTITKPYRVRGLINIAVIYRLADEQTITIYFHTGGSNLRVQPNDELISWKWMLNKLDTTIAVAPEQGVELDLRTVARRVMQLAIKNSATFSKQNAKKAETLANIEALKGQITAAEMELAGIQGQTAAREIEQQAAVAAEAAKLAANKLDPAEAAQLSAIGVVDDDMAAITPYATYAAFAADPVNHVQAVAITRQRALAVRNALRGRGWLGEMWAPLTRARNNSLYGVMVNPLADMTNFSITLNVLTEMGEGIVGSVSNDMTLGAEDLAAQIDAMLEPEAVATGDAVVVDAPAASDVPNPEPAGEIVIPGDGSGVAVSKDGPFTPEAAAVVAAAVASEQPHPNIVVSPELPAALEAPAIPATTDAPIVDVASAETPAVADPILVAGVAPSDDGKTGTVIQIQESGLVPPETAREHAESGARAVESMLTYDLNFLQSVADGSISAFVDGLAERIEMILKAYPENPEVQAKGKCAIDVYTCAVLGAARASMDAVQQVPDPLHDTPPAGQRANESEVESEAQQAAGAVAVRQQNAADWPTPVTVVPVPEKSSLDTALVEPGNPTGVLTPPVEPVTPEQAAAPVGGDVLPAIDTSGKLAEQPTAPDMPSVDKPVTLPVFDNAAEVAQIEPTESSREPARLIQIQQNGQSERILAEAKADVGAELLATEPNQPIPTPDVEPAPEIKPVPDTKPHPETPSVVEQNPLPVQGDPATPLDASPAGVPQTVTDAPPAGDATVTQVPDPLHDTPPVSEQAAVAIPADPAQTQADKPIEVVQREADQAYLDSVIDGSERGESGRIGALFDTYVTDEPMIDRWRDAVAAFTARLKS